MIRPTQQDEVFLADAQSAAADPWRFHLWWLGQSGFLLRWQQRYLAFDPYLSDSLTRKYAATDKPHVRLTERVVAPEALGFVHVVTSSHTHTDHLDADTLVPMLRANPKLEIVIPEATRETVVDRLGVVAELPVGLNAGQSARVAGFEFHAVPAAHEGLEKDDRGRHRFLGYVVRFGGWTVYHSGDTVRYEGMDRLLRRWKIDVALLPINGRRPERRVAGNLSGREAAELARDIGAGVVVPCHYEMFEFNTASPDDFTAACRELGQPFHVLRAGERWTSQPIG